MRRLLIASLIAVVCAGMALADTLEGKVRGVAKSTTGFGIGTLEISEFYFIQPETKLEDWPSADDEMKVGERVTVVYVKEGDKFIARRVRLLSFNDGSVGSRGAQAEELGDGELVVEGVIGSASRGKEKTISAISVGWIFNVNDETEFLGKKSLAEIKLGDAVSIQYVVSGVRNVARRITVSTS